MNVAKSRGQLAGPIDNSGLVEVDAALVLDFAL